jgi:flagellar biosynthesis/type III secretory pathway M-ring protein FliF/YscJ
MAEGVTPATGGRQVITIATVVTVVFFTFFVVGLRSCSISPGQGTDQSKLPANVVIYSNLDLKDSALVIVRLKELKIPYQIRDEGRSIAVPRGRADEARLGLAEKNLPAGGTVGWEIFDQARLGATDFDRRIQFIRAISGELARTINRISAVEDARVQIVIPETKLFEVAKAPVTASVLLKLKPGETLSQRQVNGIMYLVAGSVENLKPENITLVDTNGNMLSGAENIPAEAEEAAPARMEEKVIVEKEEEKAALGVQAKLDLENTLTSKSQSMLNRLYPPNVTIARVSIDSIQTRKTTVIILVDKKFKIDKALKKSTFETISAIVGYDKERGDKIIMKSVPFRAAAPEEVKAATLALSTLKTIYRKYGRESAVVIGVLFLLVLLSIFGLFGRGKKEYPVEEIREEAAREEEVPIVDQMKEMASQNPELVAQLIRSWVKQEGS